MKTFKFSLVLRTRENTDVFITLDDNNYDFHSKRVNILYVPTIFLRSEISIILVENGLPDRYGWEGYVLHKYVNVLFSPRIHIIPVPADRLYTTVSIFIIGMNFIVLDFIKVFTPANQP